MRETEISLLAKMTCDCVKEHRGKSEPPLPACSPVPPQADSVSGSHVLSPSVRCTCGAPAPRLLQSSVCILCVFTSHSSVPLSVHFMGEDIPGAVGALCPVLMEGCSVPSHEWASVYLPIPGHWTPRLLPIFAALISLV